MLNVTVIECLEPRRLMALLTADVRFGTAGEVAGVYDTASYVGQTDGRIVASTLFTDESGAPTASIVRYHADGTIDPRFRPYSSPVRSLAADVDHQARVTVGGAAGYSATTVLFNRLTPSGRPDLTFGRRGSVVLTLPTVQTPGEAYTDVGQLIVGSDGSVLAIVTATIFDSKRYATTRRTSLTRLTSDGRLDTDFGVGGYVDLGIVRKGDSPTIRMEADSRGRIYLAISGTNSVARLRPSGSRDTAFGVGGKVGLRDGDPFVLDAAGRLVVSGTFGGSANLLRYDTRGQRDITFGRSGTVDTANFSDFDNPPNTQAILPQADGTLIVQIQNTLYHVTADGVSTPTGDAVAATILARQPDGAYLGYQGYNSLGRFAVPAPAALAGSANRSTPGTLYLRGDSSADHYEVHADGDQIVITANGQTQRFDLASVSDINADFGDGDNVFTSTLNLTSEVRTGLGKDRITTGNGGDRIYTGLGADTIDSGGGVDAIYPGGGSNVIDVGDDERDNAVIISPNERRGGFQRITGNGGLNGTLTVDIRNNTSADIVYSGYFATITLSGGDNVVAVMTRRGSLIDTGAGNDRITTSSGNDSISPGAGDDTVRAGAGDDVVQSIATLAAGTADDDLIYLDAGNDLAADRYGSNTVSGGDGQDRIDGGQGNDRLRGDDGNDLLRDINGGDDSLTGEYGRDTLVGGPGNDTLDGGPGNDVLYALAGGPTVGSLSRNILIGGPGNDRAVREGDRDVLTEIESVT